MGTSPEFILLEFFSQSSLLLSDLLASRSHFFALLSFSIAVPTLSPTSFYHSPFLLRMQFSRCTCPFSIPLAVAAAIAAFPVNFVRFPTSARFDPSRLFPRICTYFVIALDRQDLPISLLILRSSLSSSCYSSVAAPDSI